MNLKRLKKKLLKAYLELHQLPMLIYLLSLPVAAFSEETKRLLAYLVINPQLEALFLEVQLHQLPYLAVKLKLNLFLEVLQPINHSETRRISLHFSEELHPLDSLVDQVIRSKAVYLELPNQLEDYFHSLLQINLLQI